MRYLDLPLDNPKSIKQLRLISWFYVIRQDLLDSVNSVNGLSSDSKLTITSDSSHAVLEMPALSPTMVSYFRRNLGVVTADYLFVDFSPNLSPSSPNDFYFPQNQGNIAKWRKKEGDKVSLTSFYE